MSNTQVIERTGKKWKACQLIGALAMLVGAVLFFAGNSGQLDDAASTYGLAALALGAPVWFVGSLLGWWHHG